MVAAIVCDNVEQQMRDFYGSLNEKDRRRYAALEANKVGHGGITRICRILGCDPKTVRRGIKELRNPLELEPRKVRKKGRSKES